MKYGAFLENLVCLVRLDFVETCALWKDKAKGWVRPDGGVLEYL